MFGNLDLVEDIFIPGLRAYMDARDSTMKFDTEVHASTVSGCLRAQTMKLLKVGEEEPLSSHSLWSTQQGVILEEKIVDILRLGRPDITYTRRDPSFYHGIYCNTDWWMELDGVGVPLEIKFVMSKTYLSIAKLGLYEASRQDKFVRSYWPQVNLYSAATDSPGTYILVLPKDPSEVKKARTIRQNQLSSKKNAADWASLHEWELLEAVTTYGYSEYIPLDLEIVTEQLYRYIRIKEAREKGVLLEREFTPKKDSYCDYCSLHVSCVKLGLEEGEPWAPDAWARIEAIQQGEEG